MISKNKLKELAVYKQQKRCDEDGVFVVEGVKMCGEITAAHRPILAVCATNSWLFAHQNEVVCDSVFEVSEEELERLSGQKSPNEVWMLMDRKDCMPVEVPQGRLTLVLDHLQDPGNMGTIIRTADWFGIRQIVCSTNTVSCFNPKVVQSTMGGLFRTQIIYTDLVEYLDTCKCPIIGAVLDGESIWSHVKSQLLPSERAMLVIGNESRGISPEVQKCITRRVKIPNIGGTAESLNASVAAAILCAELLKNEK